MWAGLFDQLPDGVNPCSFEALHYNLEQFDFLSTTLNGTGSVYAQTVGPPHERSVIFRSPRMSRVMGQCREVFTSMQKICAAPPNQHCKLYMYQVSCISHDRVISLMLAVMQSPSYEALRATLLSLQESVPAFNPVIVNIPYCQKEKGAWEEVFHCATQFLFISYVKAVLKNIHTPELSNVVAADSKVRSLLRSCLSVPLLPFGMMRRGLAILKRRAQRSVYSNTLMPFLVHYFNIWMNGERYDTLSVFLQSNRLSDASNVAMRNLLLKTGSHYPHIWHLIDAIRQYEWRSYISSRRARRGLSVGRGQKVSTLRNDTVIRNCTVELLAGEMSIKQFLRVTSTRVIGVFYDTLRLRGLVH